MKNYINSFVILLLLLTSSIVTINANLTEKDKEELDDLVATYHDLAIKENKDLFKNILNWFGNDLGDDFNWYAGTDKEKLSNLGALLIRGGLSASMFVRLAKMLVDDPDIRTIEVPEFVSLPYKIKDQEKLKEVKEYLKNKIKELDEKEKKS